MYLLKVENISKQDQKGNVLVNISFFLKSSQKLAIAGETGSGKSTLLKIIAGLEQPSEGQVYFEDKRIKGPNEELIPGHKSIAYLSQHFELPNFLTVEQVLIYANPLSDAEAEHDVHAKALYEMCSITHLLKRRTDQLSGGEKQRVALTRLLLKSPKLLLLDEPFSNLDSIHKGTLKSVIEQVTKKLLITCIMVSHDAHDTLSWADNVLILKNGELIQQGNPKEVYLQPKNEYSAGLFGKFNLIERAFAEKHLGYKIQDNLFIRPEFFSLSKTGNAFSIKGVVNKVLFFGGFYDVEILVINTHITVKVLDAMQLSIGDIAYITLRRG